MLLMHICTECSNCSPEGMYYICNCAFVFFPKSKSIAALSRILETGTLTSTQCLKVIPAMAVTGLSSNK